MAQQRFDLHKAFLLEHGAMLADDKMVDIRTVKKLPDMTPELLAQIQDHKTKLREARDDLHKKRKADEDPDYAAKQKQKDLDRKKRRKLNDYEGERAKERENERRYRAKVRADPVLSAEAKQREHDRRTTPEFHAKQNAKRAANPEPSRSASRRSYSKAKIEGKPPREPYANRDYAREESPRCRLLSAL